jgi:hypothetical protein
VVTGGCVLLASVSGGINAWWKENSPSWMSNSRSWRVSRPATTGERCADRPSRRPSFWSARTVIGYTNAALRASSLRRHFKNFVFVSVGVIDSGGFKGEGGVARLRESTEAMLGRYVGLGPAVGIPAAYA